MTNARERTANEPERTLVGFLLARIVEDEQAAHEAIAMRDSISFTYPPDVPDMDLRAWPDVGQPAVLVGPERVLAECEAKRRIIGNHPHRVDSDDVPLGCETCHNGYTDGYCIAYRALALPYADHPDYRDEWRP